MTPYFMLFAFVGLAYVLMLMAGSPLIGWLKRLKGMKWSPREDTPDSHLQKAGTPSMGGIGIVGTALVAYVTAMLFFVGSSSFLNGGPTGFRTFVDAASVVVFPLIVVLHALLGFVDDWSKARGKGGLLARQKLLGQVVLALLFVIAVQALTGDLTTFSSRSLGIVVGSFVLLLLVVIGTSNAVNITDGIDGLAAGLSVQVAATFGLVLFGLFGGRSGPGDELMLFGLMSCFFWVCLGGSCLGFLAFNKYPAKVFMGDTGSLALGAALGAGAILTRSVFLLPFVGFIFFVEMFSVIIQVSYFKYTKKKYGEGRRVFRRAPLHHHFELGGWSERRVVGTFWAINALTTIVGLLLWKVGILPRFP